MQWNMQWNECAEVLVAGWKWQAHAAAAQDAAHEHDAALMMQLLSVAGQQCRQQCVGSRARSADLHIRLLPVRAVQEKLTRVT